MDNFDRRLRAELHREFDEQHVRTPPPHRARYGRLARTDRRRPPLRTVALATAVFAVGVMVGLVYGGRVTMVPVPGRPIGAVPSSSSSATASPSPFEPATARPAPAQAPTRPPATHRPPASPSASPAVPSFVDDFSADAVGANPPSGWLVDDGQWTGVVDDGGHVVRHGAGLAAGHLVAGSPLWADYTVSADVSTSLLGLGFAGVAGRYQDAGDAYECGLGVGGQLQLWLVRGGQRTILAASGLTLDLSGHHTVSLAMKGTRLTCSVDGGAQSLQAADATYSAGRIALVASAGEGVEYGNVHVSH